MTDKLSFTPLAELRNYREALRQMLDSGWILPRDLMPSPMNVVVFPVDVLDNGTEIVIKASLPGINPEDVTISVQSGILTIKAVLSDAEDIRGAVYLRRERRADTFTRSLKLPAAVEAERSEARFKNGVLTLTLPKARTVRPHILKVVSGKG